MVKTVSLVYAKNNLVRLGYAKGLFKPPDSRERSSSDITQLYIGKIKSLCRQVVILFVQAFRFDAVKIVNWRTHDLTHFKHSPAG